jgi:hypothetical protein
MFYDDIYHCRLKITPSKIPHAGLGVFAVDKIYLSYTCKYEGEFVTVRPQDGRYSWAIRYVSPEEERPSPFETDIIGYRDGKKERHWTSYVNCSNGPNTANIATDQFHHDIYYSVWETIKPGEELLVWYGDEYYRGMLHLD